MATLYDPVQCDLESFQNTYVMGPELWEKFNIDDLEISIANWGCVKMMDDQGVGLNEQTATIPNASGGIYVYIIRPPVIPGCGEYIMYIGKATKTPNENLRRRVRAYKEQFDDDYTRDKVHRLFFKWGKYVYVRYLPVESTPERIGILEDRLIAALTPPCNPDIRIKSVKRAVKAFNYV